MLCDGTLAALAHIPIRIVISAQYICVKNITARETLPIESNIVTFS
jgi:hypothetical protein